MSISAIINYFRNDNFKILHISLVVIGIFALSLAYFVEYILGFSPCPLCVYQRFPYLFIIKISFVALIIKQISKYALFFIVLNLLGGGILAGYHTGIERGVFSPSALCSTLIHIPKHLSIDDIKEMLYSQPVALCNKVAVKLLGLSMTEWNLLFILGLLCVVLIIWFYPQDIEEDKIIIN